MPIRATDPVCLRLDIKPAKAMLVHSEMICVKKYKTLICSESYGKHAGESSISLLDSV